MITTALMKQLGWVYPDAWAASFAVACPTYGIITKDRVAAFLAQVGHESGGGRFTKEIWGPTQAQAKYEGRRDLGNTEKGDGLRFRGRGAIQITGRANTTMANYALKPDMALDVFCSWLETAEGAGMSAAWWWSSWKLNELADAGRFDDITRRINGGFNGRDDRIARWTKAKAALAENPVK